MSSRKFFLFIISVLLVQFALAQSPVPASPDVESKVNSILSKMTLEEKIDYIGGFEDFDVRAIPRLGLPAIKMSDGPAGVRNYGPATTIGGIALAATWDPELVHKVGAVFGDDSRARGVHILLGPGVNIYRAPMAGRDFEYFGEDPYLAARTAVAYVEGLQSKGVCATIKHYMGNNQEYDRHNVDSLIDERTMREIYLPTFEAAVKQGHVCAIMDSYNLTNGQHMSQNGYLNNDVAKKEWGFDGIIMSDWDSTYDGVAAVNGGLDLEMPAGAHMNRAHAAARNQSGESQRGYHRRPRPPHPPENRAIRLARPGTSRLFDSRLQHSGPRRRSGGCPLEHCALAERRQPAASRQIESEDSRCDRTRRVSRTTRRWRQRRSASLSRSQLPRGHCQYRRRGCQSHVFTRSAHAFRDGG